MNDTAFKDEFHRLLGRLVHAMAAFDFNVGLQLLNCGVFSQDDLHELLSPCRTQLKTRLIALRRMVRKTFQSAGERAIAEFSEWFDRADECRALRNDYVHGRWGVPGRYEFTPPGTAVDRIPLLSFLPLTWEMSPDSNGEEIALTLEEFAQQVKIAEQLIVDFWTLYDRHICFSSYRYEH